MLRSEGAVLLLFVILVVFVFALAAGVEVHALLGHLDRAFAGLQR